MTGPAIPPLIWRRPRPAICAQRLDGSACPPHRLDMGRVPEPTEESRARLIADIAVRADRAAFIALFEFYAPRIKAQAMRFGLGADAAEDVAQDAMLALWRRASQFDPARGSASAWVFTIATHARIDRMRRDKRLAGAAEIDADSPLLAVEATTAGGVDAARLSRCVEDLPDDQRRILHMSFFSEISHGDIARKLGVPLGTVKSRIRLGIAKLRQALRDEP
jgi:RNA polymerase sigma-70 factor (ECF subfamily)